MQNARIYRHANGKMLKKEDSIPDTGKLWVIEVDGELLKDSRGSIRRFSKFDGAEDALMKEVNKKLKELRALKVQALQKAKEEKIKEFTVPEMPVQNFDQVLDLFVKVTGNNELKQYLQAKVDANKVLIPA